MSAQKLQDIMQAIIYHKRCTASQKTFFSSKKTSLGSMENTINFNQETGLALNLKSNHLGMSHVHIVRKSAYMCQQGKDKEIY